MLNGFTVDELLCFVEDTQDMADEHVQDLRAEALQEIIIRVII